MYILENLGCAHCAAKMEEQINALPGVEAATITYATKQLRLSAEHPDKLLPQIQKICASIESQVVVKPRDEKPEKQEDSDKKDLRELILGGGLFLVGVIAHKLGLSDLLCLPVFLWAT